MSALLYDWKKYASEAAVPDDAIEKAFFDQAIAFVQNKAKPLMQDPYRLGFEIIKKAGDDNTKMVGIFAFRVGRDLLYVPAFFLNGDIKGTDLLYQVTKKLFVPCTPDQCKALLNQEQKEEGSGVSRGERKKHPADMQLRRIAFPPFTHHGIIKGASAEAEVYADDTTQDWEVFLKSACEIAPLAPILKAFLLDEPTGGAWDKVAHALLNSVAFSDRLIAGTDVGEYCFEHPRQGLQKAAATDGCLEVVLAQPIDPTQPYKTSFSKAAAYKDLDSEKFYRSGYDFIDTRTKIRPVYEDDEQKMGTVTGIGYYKVLLNDGTVVDAYCGREADAALFYSDYGCGSTGPVPHLSPWTGYVTPEPTVFVTADHEYGKGSLVLGEAVEDPQSNIDTKATGPLLEDEMSIGKAYLVLDRKTGTFSEPIKVVGKETKDGITIYDVVKRYSRVKKELKHNPDYHGISFEDGIIGDFGAFVEVKTTAPDNRDGAPSYEEFDLKKVTPGDEDNLRQFLLGGGFKFAAVKYDGMDYYITSRGYNSGALSKIAAIAGLASGFEIAAETADELVKAATDKGEKSFFVEYDLEKEAGTIRLLTNPVFRSLDNNDFGIETDFPQRFRINTLTEGEIPPESRVGDAWDPSQGAGPVRDGDDDTGLPIDTLLGSTPQQLASLQQQDGIPNLFSTGVVGSLLDTYDSAVMVDKYLPDLEQGLDRLGRMLFLFYWKPGDYQSLFGVDDMTNLENKLLSNFKSFGDVVLDLKQRNKNRQQGTTPEQKPKA